MNRAFPIFKVTKKAEYSLKNGHPWVYAAEITSVSETPENGSLVDVQSEKGTYLGTGLYSEKSKIHVRILSSNTNDIFDEQFFERRIRYAVLFRQTVMREDFDNCRLIFGEADGLPGLTIDRFGKILVAEVLSYGIDKRKDMIFRLLLKVLDEVNVGIEGIYERNNISIRKLEGLSEYRGWYKSDFLTHPHSTITNITENGITYEVDFENGQKTGYFLDQKYNRQLVAKLSLEKNVLDCFTHTGSFALNAVKGGAKHVTAVDISQYAIDMAKKNAQINGFTEKMDFKTCDVFDFLLDLSQNRQSPYDFIILDPPAFTKSSKTVYNASKGYYEINFRAMKLLPRGGYLATCSCSHFMRNDLFVGMLKKAAYDANVQLKQIEERQQSPDHPILWNVPETDYLKFYVFQII